MCYHRLKIFFFLNSYRICYFKNMSIRVMHYFWKFNFGGHLIIFENSLQGIPNFEVGLLKKTYYWEKKILKFLAQRRSGIVLDLSCAQKEEEKTQHPSVDISMYSWPPVMEFQTVKPSCNFSIIGWSISLSENYISLELHRHSGPWGGIKHFYLVERGNYAGKKFIYYSFFQKL